MHRCYVVLYCPPLYCPTFYLVLIHGTAISDGEFRVYNLKVQLKGAFLMM